MEKKPEINILGADFNKVTRSTLKPIAPIAKTKKYLPTVAS